MSVLNKTAYVMENDDLIYDAKHPIDATVVQVKITADKDGVLLRGQLLDYEDGSYVVHAEKGEACAIVAETTSYAADDTGIAVAVYISGSFRANRIIAGPEVTEADWETLRTKGIYLK